MFNIVSEIIYNLNKIICNIIAAIIGWLFDLVESVGLSINRIIASFPGLDKTVYGTVVVVGCTLTLLFFVFGILQFLFPNSEVDLPAENPFLLVFRFIVSLLLVINFKTFFIDVFVNKLFIPVFNDISTNFETKSGNYWLNNIIAEIESLDSSTLAQIVNFVIIILFGLTFLISTIKFVIYHFERLFELTFLIYVSPLACSTYTHKALSPMFKNYIKLMVEQALCIIFNLVIVKLIINGLQTINTTTMLGKTAERLTENGSLLSDTKSYFLGTTKNYVIQMLFLTAILSVGKKMSVKVGQVLGVNGMSDTVRGGLGAIGAIGGFAAHSVMHRGGSNNTSTKPVSTSGNNGTAADTFAEKIGDSIYKTTGNEKAAAIVQETARKVAKPFANASTQAKDKMDNLNGKADDIKSKNAADTESVDQKQKSEKADQKNGTKTEQANTEAKPDGKVSNEDKNPSETSKAGVNKSDEGNKTVKANFDNDKQSANKGKAEQFGAKVGKATGEGVSVATGSVEMSGIAGKAGEKIGGNVGRGVDKVSENIKQTTVTSGNQTGSPAHSGNRPGSRNNYVNTSNNVSHSVDRTQPSRTEVSNKNAGSNSSSELNSSKSTSKSSNDNESFSKVDIDKINPSNT